MRSPARSWQSMPFDHKLVVFPTLQTLGSLLGYQIYHFLAVYFFSIFSRSHCCTQ